MKKEIEELRKYMRDNGLDVYYVPSGDPHGSEYVNPYYESCVFLSGLTSEAADLLITMDGAYLWTDGRYFLQAERQLAGSGIELMRSGEPGVPTLMDFLKDLIDNFAKEHEDDSFVIGMDGKVTPASWGKNLKETFRDYKLVVRWQDDLVNPVWKDRPQIAPSHIWKFPLSSAGKTASEKVSEMRAALKEKGADCLLISDLMESAWLLNLRGADIAYTPVFFSYVILTQDYVRLYVMNGALENGLPFEEKDDLSFVEVRDYNDIYDDVAALPADWKIWMNSASAGYALYLSIGNEKNIIDEMTPVALAKTVKNPVEIRNTLNAHIKDGVAVTKFIKWIKDVAVSEPQTEISAADHLEALRREQEGCFDLSFETISGYGPNAAIIHYAPTPETDLDIRPEGFLLVDSGGQYIDGTTDITRTIAVGPLTQEMIDDYTLVLKGHIAVSRYVITPETTHKELDAASREPLRSVGLEFGHGVSHGVGHVLAVHEGPAGIRKTDVPCGLKPGMIVSNEPGYYLGGHFGIRIENEILMKDGGNGTVISEPITMVPYERQAINTELLTDEEIEWVNNYHDTVRKTLVPIVDDETAEFVIRQTAPLSK